MRLYFKSAKEAHASNAVMFMGETMKMVRAMKLTGKKNEVMTMADMRQAVIMDDLASDNAAFEKVF